MTENNSRIRTVAQLVRAFGGTKRFAEWLDVGDSTVSNWKREGEIPPGWHLRIDRELRRRGFEFDDDVFTLRGPERKSRRPKLSRSKSATLVAA